MQWYVQDLTKCSGVADFGEILQKPCKMHDAFLVVLSHFSITSLRHLNFYSPDEPRLGETSKS